MTMSSSSTTIVAGETATATFTSNFIAGVAGDSITVAPSMTLTDREFQNLRDLGIRIIRAVGVDTGGCNIQFAIKDDKVYVIEASPRASRTVPFIAKAYDEPYVNYATKVMLGDKKVKDSIRRHQKERAVHKVNGLGVNAPLSKYYRE
jgi:carbamoyl-phosphate synthase large subunit